jgi:hypothetical protein
MKQPRCPTTDEWIKKMWYLYTMEFYAAMNYRVLSPCSDSYQVAEPQWNLWLTDSIGGLPTSLPFSGPACAGSVAAVSFTNGQCHLPFTSERTLIHQMHEEVSKNICMFLLPTSNWGQGMRPLGLMCYRIRKQMEDPSQDHPRPASPQLTC